MSNQIALVTGASRGLGRATALQLAAHGVDSVITYLSSADEAAAVVAEIEGLDARAVALQLDTADTAGFADFARRFQATLADTWNRATFDFLVNNAGDGVHAPFLETTEDGFDRMMNVHVKGVFFLTQRLVPHLEDGGHIVNISSGLARFSMPGYAAYATAKGAVEVLTRYLASELGPRQVAVNTIAPGAVETDFGGGAVRDDEELNKMIASVTALGRVGLPDDIGGAVSSLLTGGNRWITGQRIEVSGGMNL